MDIGTVFMAAVLGEEYHQAQQPQEQNELSGDARKTSVGEDASYPTQLEKEKNPEKRIQPKAKSVARALAHKETDQAVRHPRNQEAGNAKHHKHSQRHHIA